MFNQIIGDTLYRLGFTPTFSTGIHEGTTGGYHEMKYGFFRFPLSQKMMEKIFSRKIGTCEMCGKDVKSSLNSPKSWSYIKWLMDNMEVKKSGMGAMICWDCELEEQANIPPEMTLEYWESKENAEHTPFGIKDEYGGL